MKTIPGLSLFAGLVLGLVGLFYAADSRALVALRDLKMHDQPSESSAIVGDIQIGERDIEIDELRTKGAPGGWIAVVPTRRSPPHVGGWIQRGTLARQADFKRVTGCWPVRESVPTSGEAPWKVRFKTNGAAVLIPLNVPGGSREAYPAHVYMAGNVLFVKANHRTKDTLGFFGEGYMAFLFILDPATVSLTTPEWDTETKRFSDKAMANCRGIHLAK
jgi:hypothetical protein